MLPSGHVVGVDGASVVGDWVGYSVGLPVGRGGLVVGLRVGLRVGTFSSMNTCKKIILEIDKKGK